MSSESWQKRQPVNKSENFIRMANKRICILLKKCIIMPDGTVPITFCQGLLIGNENLTQPRIKVWLFGAYGDTMAAEVPIMSEAIVAYRSVTADEKFKELERLRSRARHNEASALGSARRKERAKWQGVVAEKEAAIAEKEAAIAEKETAIAEQATLIAELRAQLAETK